jgi:HEAT repeat protein
LEGDDPTRRRGALLALAYLGDARAAGPLTEILEPKNGHPWRVRNRAARALGYVDHPPVVDTLLTLLEDEPHFIVHEGLVHGLGATGDPRAVQPLIEALKHGSCDVRIEAAIGLGRIGDARAVELLTAALDVGEVHPADPDRIERLRKEIRRALAACADHPAREE